MCYNAEMEYSFTYKNSCLKRYYRQSMRIKSGNAIKIYYTIYPLNTYYFTKQSDENDLGQYIYGWRWLLKNGYIIQHCLSADRVVLASDGATGRIHYPIITIKGGVSMGLARWIDGFRFTKDLKKDRRIYGEPDGSFAVRTRCITNRESLRLWCAINIGRDMFTGARHSETPISAWVWGKNVKGLDGLRDLVSVHNIPRGLLITPHPKAKLTRSPREKTYYLTAGANRWRVPVPKKEMIDG